MLYHVTSVANLQSIRQKGLLTSMSTGKRQRVWMVAEERLSWALAHVKQRHGLDPRAVVCIIVYDAGIPLRRHALEGVYYTEENVTADKLGDAFQLTRCYVQEGYPPDDNPHTGDPATR